MKHLIATLLLCLTSICAQAKTMTIGIDLSGSNPLLSHKNFATMASQYVTAKLSKLKNGDIVRVKTFGARADAANLLNRSYKISRRVKPKKIAGIIAQYLQSLPEQKDLSQSATNLIAWLEFTSDFNCADKSTILAITDGLESSSYVDGSALLTGKKGLPEADVDLKGCAIIFYGLGAGWPAQSVKFVRNEWRQWSEKAGASFTAIIP